MSKEDKKYTILISMVSIIGICYPAMITLSILLFCDPMIGIITGFIIQLIAGRIFFNHLEHIK